MTVSFPPYTIIQQHVGGTTKTHYLDGDGVVDGLAYDVDVSIINNGETANIVVSKWDTSGIKGDERLLNMQEVEPGAKADSVTAKQSGSNLILTIRYHVGDYNTKVIRTVLVGYLHPYPGNRPQVGMEGAFVPGGQPSVDFTLQQIIDGVVAALQPDFTRVIGNMKPKAAAAILEAHVITEPDFNDGAHGGSATVFAQLVNTSFTGALGALHAQGDSAVMSKTQLPALPMKVPVAHKMVLADPIEAEAEAKPKRGKDCEDGA